MFVSLYDREASPGDPGGVTVSKQEELPQGSFALTEHVWPDGTTLWFVDDDEFTEDQRQRVYEAFKAQA